MRILSRRFSRTLLLAAMVLAACGSVATLLVALGPQGVGTFHAREMTIDAGTVRQGEVVEANFELVNDSPELVHVARITTSCGCTIVRPTRREVAPGESLTLPALLDTRKRHGPARVSIAVAFVRGELSSLEYLTLRLSAKIEPEIFVEPAALHVADSAAPGRFEVSFRASDWASMESLAIREANINSKAFRIIEVRQANAKHIVLCVAYDPTNVAPDDIPPSLELVVRTNGAVQDTYVLPIDVSSKEPAK